MSKVWIVELHVDYEGSSIHAVSATEDGAFALADTERDTDTDWKRRDGYWIAPTKAGSYEDKVTVTEYEVKP